MDDTPHSENSKKKKKGKTRKLEENLFSLIEKKITGGKIIFMKKTTAVIYFSN